MCTSAIPEMQELLFVLPALFQEDNFGDGQRRLGSGCEYESLLANADAESLHFSIEVAALEAEEFSGAAHVVAGLLDFLEDVIALVRVAGLLESGEIFFSSRRGFVGERRELAPLDAQCARVEDEDAFNDVLQFADVSGPVVLLKNIEGLFADLHARAAILTAEVGEELTDKERDVLFSIP